MWIPSTVDSGRTVRTTATPSFHTASKKKKRSLVSLSENHTTRPITHPTSKRRRHTRVGAGLPTFDPGSTGGEGGDGGIEPPTSRTLVGRQGYLAGTRSHHTTQTGPTSGLVEIGTSRARRRFSWEARTGVRTEPFDRTNPKVLGSKCGFDWRNGKGEQGSWHNGRDVVRAIRVAHGREEVRRDGAKDVVGPKRSVCGTESKQVGPSRDAWSSRRALRGRLFRRSRRSPGTKGAIKK